MRATYSASSFVELGERPYTNASVFECWGREESAVLAATVSYDGGKILKSPRNDGAFELSADYISNAKPVADRQGALAGYRIAEVLAKLFGDAVVPAMWPTNN